MMAFLRTILFGLAVIGKLSGNWEFVYAEESDLVDESDDCEGWAEAGECTANSAYMLKHCAASCQGKTVLDHELGVEIDKKIGHINSFFELEAEDIDENVISFQKYRGGVTVITNVASYCGYTDSHYRGLVELYDEFKNEQGTFNILAFPCNQFGKQEPGTCSNIKRFAQSKYGVTFTMMNKIEVNGLDAHPVYHYLKKVAGPPTITWNFATYYVVTPDGTVASFSGVEPMELEGAILEAWGHNGDWDDDDDDVDDDEYGDEYGDDEDWENVYDAWDEGDEF